MPSWVISLIIAGAIVVVVLLVMRHLNKRAEAKQAEQNKAIEQYKQQVNMMVIDKKMMPIKDSGLPQMVIDQTPKLMRRSKLPIVKVKAGPRIMTMVADSKIFDLIPVKKEVKAVVSGIYIMEGKGIRAPLEAPEKKKLSTR